MRTLWLHGSVVGSLYSSNGNAVAAAGEDYGIICFLVLPTQAPQLLLSTLMLGLIGLGMTPMDFLSTPLVSLHLDTSLSLAH